MNGPSPSSAVRREFLRALGDLVLGPARAAVYLARRGGARAEIRELLGRPAALAPAPDDATLAVALERTGLGARQLRLFVSCAEASGEIHTLSLVRALRDRAEALGLPPPEFLGLGGPALADEGVELVGDPVTRATMGFSGVTGSLPYYMGLLRDSAAALRSGVDACVPVDSPALHVPLMHIARRYGVPSVHFVAPQYWGWAPWRAGGYRRAASLALSILPWEPAWFERRGITCLNVGHPLLDHLRDVPATRPTDVVPGEAPGPLVLLPGSRASVVELNLPWMLDVTARLRERHPELEVVLVQASPELGEALQRILRAARAETWVRVASSDLHAELTAARCALSVSGTVLLDLLHHRLPSIVVYRLKNKLELWAADAFLTTPWFSATNLLADRELLPEFHFPGQGPLEIACAALERCYKDGPWRADCIEGLDRVAARLGGPGACERAARHVLGTLATVNGPEGPRTPGDARA